jgi:formylglycine-generating enzyme required for sulfatase activity
MQAVVAGKELVELVPVLPGEFLMGSDNQFFSQAPAHLVKIRSGFFLGRYPITQGQWLAVMGNNPSAFRDSPDRPVDSVSWEQVAEFCARLGDQSDVRSTQAPADRLLRGGRRGGRLCLRSGGASKPGR